MQDPPSFGDILRGYRKAHDLTQEELAERIDYSVETIKKVEADTLRPSKGLVGKLIDVLHIDKDEQATFLRLARRAPELPGSLAESVVARAPHNPYKGLRAFEEDDAHDFFGRDELIRRLLARLAEPDRLARFLAVVGPSGSGKSSVVRAGLLPALRRGSLPGSDQWRLELLSSPLPLEAAAAALPVEGLPSFEVLRHRQASNGGQHQTIVEAAPGRAAVERVLVIDQFEEIITQIADPAACASFLHLYACVTHPRSSLRIIITLRADCYDRPLLYPRFGQLVRQRTEVVLPLTPEELQETIVRPAARVGVTVEPALVAAIVHDVGAQPGALPLLQYALTDLFDYQGGRPLTPEAYRARGGVARSLARSADTLYASLDTRGQAIARQLFLRLITVGDGMPDTRRRVRRAELDFAAHDSTMAAGAAEAGMRAAPALPPDPATDGSDDLDAVLERFGRARLLTFDRDPVTHEPTVEVAHEALILTWEQLRAWLDICREALRVQRRLLAAATEWSRAGQDPSFLATGMRLVEFASLAESGRVALNTTEQTYLEVSIAERERQEAAERERHQRELAQALALADAQRQRAEVQVAATAGLRRRALFLAVALTLALVALVTATVFRIRAERSFRLAQARALVADGQNVFAERPLLGLRLALEGLALVPADEPNTRAALGRVVATLAAQGRLVQVAQDGERIAGAPNGSVFLLDRTAPQCELRRIADGTLVITQDGDLCAATYSPNGVYVLIRSIGPAPSYTIRSSLRRTTDGGLVPPGSGIANVVFSPNSVSYVVSYMDNTPAELRHTTDDTVVQLSTSNIVNVVFSPDSAVFFVMPFRGASADLRRTSDGTVVTTLSGVRSVQFSPNGRFFVVRYRNNTPTELRRTSDGTPITGFQERGIPLREVDSSVSIGPDSSDCVLSNKSGKIVTANPDSSDFVVFGNLVCLLPKVVENIVDFSPDSNSFVAHYQDGTAELRRTAFGSHVAWVSDFRFSPDLTALIRDIDTISFSPDSASFAIHYHDNTEELRRTLDGALVALPQSRVSNIAFSPKGDAFVVSYWENRAAELRRTTNGAVVSLTREVVDVAFSPDGATFITYDSISRHAPSELRRTSDGVLVTRFTDAIQSVIFSPNGHVVVLQNGNGQSEVWGWYPKSGNGQSEVWGWYPTIRRLTTLDLGVEGRVFDALDRHMVVQYRTGVVDLLDLDWLGTMNGDPAALPVDELMRIVCIGPLASPFWTDADRQALQAGLDGQAPQLCQGK
jgi:transcriptional regulator with XRE-family HTH domain